MTDGFDSIPRHWPDALKKAVGDPFNYALGLRGVGVVTFEHAELLCQQHEEGSNPVFNPDWVKLVNVRPTNELCGYDHMNPPVSNPDQFTFDRGMEVRVSDIIWVADAPWGS